jgi:MFS family permease
MDSSQLTPTPMAAPSHPQLAPLSKPFWIFITATMLSMTGNFIQKIALAWSVWEATHATSWLAIFAVADLLPTLIVSIPAGALIDRFRPATTFWVSLSVSSLLSFILAALAFLGELTIGRLLACVILLGTCDGFSWPARLAYMAQLTPREGYARAVVLFSLSGNAAFFAGPLMAGSIISVFGVGAAYGVNAIGFLPVIIVAIAATPIRTKTPEPHEPEGVLKQMFGGFAYAVQNRAILPMLLSFAAIAFTARGVMELAPSIAATSLGGDVETLSLLTSSIALGALLAGIWMSRWGGFRERITIIVTLAGSALALIGYGASGKIALALPSAVLLGCMLAMNNISVTGAIQLYTEPRYLGRINSLYNMIYKGGPAAGATVFGWLAHISDIWLSSAAAAVALVLLMLWIVNRGVLFPAENDCSPLLRRSADH